MRSTVGHVHGSGLDRSTGARQTDGVVVLEHAIRDVDRRGAIDGPAILDATGEAAAVLEGEAARRSVGGELSQGVVV